MTNSHEPDDTLICGGADGDPGIILIGKIEGFEFTLDNPISPRPPDLRPLGEVNLEVTAMWNLPDADPLGDIRAWIDEVNANGGNPNEIVLPDRVWLTIARRMMTKRGFRRYRAKLRAARRGA